MRVPPPYVPQLSGGAPAVTGPAGYRFVEPQSEPVQTTPVQRAVPQPEAPIATEQLGDNRSSKPRFPLWLALTVREKILAGLLVFSLVMIPATLPQASAGAQGFNPSDPSLQSVERAEENFAGSAFYFTDPNFAIPQNYGTLPIDPLANTGDQPLGELGDVTAPDNVGASSHFIRPVSFRGSITDNSRALQCLTQAIYYEAGMEPDAGQRSVAQVILNRARHPSYPGTVCGVIYQGSERRTGCQFSYTCDGSLRRQPNKFHWGRSKKVAAQALAGKGYTTVGTATHYHATYVYPYWAPSLRFLGTIGAHRFYSWKGKAGKANAFTQRYRGGEPLPAPKARKYATKASSTLDPIALERAYDAGLQKAQAEAARSEKATAVAADNARRHDLPAPPLNVGAPRNYKTPEYSKEAKAKGGDKAFAGQKLPDISQIKPEYRNAGTWKKKPGS